ncbi:unnamed protein product [Leuciscus chuanchicus]
MLAMGCLLIQSLALSNFSPQAVTELAAICKDKQKKGDTPLHFAIRGRSRRLTELLLRNPKDVHLLYRPNQAGETPYKIDCRYQKSILTQIFGALVVYFGSRREGESWNWAWVISTRLARHIGYLELLLTRALPVNSPHSA